MRLWILYPVLAIGLFASDYEADPAWKNVCDAAVKKPQANLTPAGPLKPAELERCDETALYYGIGAKPDYAAALQCGWYERAHPQDTIANLFYGPGVLSMLYANGLGVPRDYGLAIRFACENGWSAEAEFALRIGHLEHLRDTHSNETFDLCNDVTSGMNEGTCALVSSRKEEVARDAKIARYVKGLPPAALTLFPALKAAETAYEEARTQGEVDLSGTARNAIAAEEQSRLRDQFLINLRRFGAGDIPAASEAQVAELDGKLNAVYQQLMHAPSSKWEFGTIKPDGIRATERQWIKLADAWIAFARAAYPKLTATSVRAQLIRLRLHQLRSLATD